MHFLPTNPVPINKFKSHLTFCLIEYNVLHVNMWYYGIKMVVDGNMRLLYTFNKKRHVELDKGVMK